MDDMNMILWNELKKHRGHKVNIVSYGDWNAPEDICLECEDCGEVVLDAELYTLCAREDNWWNVDLLRKRGNDIMVKLFKVVGRDELDGYTFAQCTTYDKAKRALELTEENGFEGMVEIVQDELPIDAIEICGEIIGL